MRTKKTDASRFSAPQVAFLIVLPLAVCVAALCIGRMNVSVADVLKSFGAKFFGGEPCAPLVESTIWRVRLPRIALALLCGAGLSASGTAFQSLFANPLATPDTLGVAGGAAFGASLGLLLGWGLIGVQALAFACGCAAVLLTVLAASGKNRGTPGAMVLAGIMIGSLFSALLSLVKFAADTENVLPAITYFLMGSLDGASGKTLAVGAPPILIGLAVLFAIRYRLNVLMLSNEEARSTGVDLARLRAVTVICATLMTASAVAMCGQVGWVGLLVPHICRMYYGNNHLTLYPASVIVGGAFLVAVDTAARSISAASIPISVLTAVIGAPFFIFLMRRTRFAER